MSGGKSVICGLFTSCEYSQYRGSGESCQGNIEFDEGDGCYRGFGFVGSKKRYYDCAPSISLTSQDRIEELLEDILENLKGDRK